MDTEFEYASKLIEAGFPDSAVFLAERLGKAHPEEVDRVNVIRAEALIDQRKLEQAAEILAQMPPTSPKTQAIKLALADGYYQVGKLDECTAIYDEYFKSHGGEIPTDPDLLRFFRNSAHKFAQMLATKGEISAAAKVYDMVVQTTTTREVRRQVLVEQAELLTTAAASATPPEAKKMLAQADEDCAEVIWGGMDLWFGRAVTCLAKISAVRGESDEATKLLSTNLEMLRALDDLLAEANVPLSESPFAAARSLLGSLYRDEARLLLGPKEEREARAVSYFEQAVKELSDVWRLIQRTRANDQSVLKRNNNDPSVLAGNRAERQKPFDDLAEVLAASEASVRESNQGGWADALKGRVNALAKGMSNLREEVAKTPKDLGVTPRAEMKFDEHSKVKKRIQYAESLLAPEGMRRKAAIDYLVKSLEQYYNVFAGYPGSSWSAEASQAVTDLKEQLHLLTGREVVIEAQQSGRRKIALVKMHEGATLFSRKEYDKAVKEYLSGLNELPEAPESFVALANLMECYAHLGDDLRVRMIGHYVAERFFDRPESAQALLRLGRLYYELKNHQMSITMYNLYLNAFPDHHAAPKILYMLGEQEWAAENHEGAIPYYKQLVERYAQSGYFAQAINRIGWAYYLKEDYKSAAEWFQRIVDEGRPGMERARGMLCLADSQRLMEDFVSAIKDYRELAIWLSAKDNPYMQDARRENKTNELQDILEQSVFFQAYCLSRIDAPADRAPAYREAAVKLYQSLVQRFPNSSLAPAALSSMGAVLLIEGKADDAAAAYEELSRRYPESDAGQNARFAMIRSLLEVDQVLKAKEVFEEMMSEGAKYPVEHFLKLGELMLKKKEYLSAIRAYRYVTAALKKSEELTPKEAGMDQRALLGIGKADVELKKYDDAVVALNDLIQRYPTSGLFYEARFMIADAYANMGRADDAIEVFRDIFQRAQEQDLINRATVELARLQIARGDKAGALASAQRIVLLADPNDPKVRPYYEAALVISVSLLGEMEKWDDVAENADRYLSLFPSGQDVNEVRRWRTKARVSTATGGGEG